MAFGTIEEAGIGGTVLALYAYAVLEVVPVTMDYKPQMLVSVAPVAVLIVFIDSFNDPIMKVIAGADFLEGIHQEVREEVGEKEFYYDHDNKQEKIDDLDRKAVGCIVNILTGTVITVSLPAVLYLETGLTGIAIGVLLAIPVSYILIHRQRNKLHNIISKLTRLY